MRSASAGVRTTCGVRMMHNSCRVADVLSYLKRLPRSGMSARRGTRLSIFVRLLVISPPSRMVSPSAAGSRRSFGELVVLTARGANHRARGNGDRNASASGARLDFSASISITTMPSGLIRGVTPRIRPT